MVRKSRKKSGVKAILVSILVSVSGITFVTIQPAQAVETALGTIELATCARGNSTLRVIDPGPFGSKDGILNSSKAILAEADESNTAIVWDLSENRQRGFEQFTLNYVGAPGGLKLTLCCQVDGRLVTARRLIGQDASPSGSYNKARTLRSSLPELANYPSSDILVRRVVVSTGNGGGLTIKKTTFGDIQLQISSNKFITPRDVELDVKTDNQSCMTARLGMCFGVDALREELQTQLQRLRDALQR